MVNVLLRHMSLPRSPAFFPFLAFTPSSVAYFHLIVICTASDLQPARSFHSSYKPHLVLSGQLHLLPVCFRTAA